LDEFRGGRKKKEKKGVVGKGEGWEGGRGRKSEGMQEVALRENVFTLATKKKLKGRQNEESWGRTGKGMLKKRGGEGAPLPSDRVGRE